MACHGHAIACTMRLTVAGSASSVVLQPNARSVNVTSAIAVASAATLNATAATCDQHRSCHFAKRPALARRRVPVEQSRELRRRVREPAEYRDSQRARRDRRHEVLQAAQADDAPRNEQQREQQEQQLQPDEQRDQAHDVDGLRAVVLEGGERHGDAGDRAEPLSSVA